MLLVLFFAFSVLGNAVHANARHGIPQLSSTAAAAVSAVPPIALGLAFHLLLKMVSAPQRTAPSPELAHSPDASDNVRDTARRLLTEAHGTESA